MLKLKPLIAEKAKEKQLSTLTQFAVPQNSAKREQIETRKELSKLAGVSLLEDRPESSFQMIPESLAGSFG